jgi:hypothetical protein
VRNESARHALRVYAAIRLREHPHSLAPHPREPLHMIDTVRDLLARVELTGLA